ncbi:MAG: GNAT family N-acetyltransferase, partial [Anaerolineae bacterium]|nr:GNAT family N-acetyltransferase [Anaerolineae bacterium]
DRAWADGFLRSRWGDTLMVIRGQVYDLREYPAFFAQQDGRRVGLATYRLDGAACELLSLDSTVERQGVGWALIQAVMAVARAAGCRRLFLVTTNDNTPALRFYQRKGFHLSGLSVGAVDAARQIKPGIPRLGIDDIPIRDEIELEIDL